MSLQFGALILALLVSAVAATEPKCHIPDGHYDREPVGYYDPEPRDG